MSIKVNDRITLEGRVVELSAPPPRWWRLEAKGRQRTDVVGGWLVLEVDGRNIRVVVPREAELLGDTTKEREALGELTKRLGISNDLGPAFDEGTLETIAIAAGDEVAVDGTIAELDFDGGGLRDTPSTGIAAVRASLVGVGSGGGRRVAKAVEAARERAEEARREVRPPEAARPKAPPANPASPLPRPSPWAWLAMAPLLAFCVVLLLFFHLGPPDPKTEMRTVYVVALGLVIAALLVRPRWRSPTFHVAAEEREGDATWFGIVIAIVAPFAGVFAVEKVGPLGVALVVAGALLLAAAVLWWLSPRLHDLARIADGSSGEHVVVEGRTNTDLRIDTECRLGSTSKKGGGFEVAEAKSSFHGGAVRIAAGEQTIEIASGEYIWGTTMFDTPPARPTQNFRLGVRLPRHSPVVAAGWRDGTQLRARGRSPVIILGTDGKGDPARLARLLVARWRSDLVLLAGGAAAVLLIELVA